MTEVFIMRHGMAEDRATSGRDRDRKLTVEGIEKTRLSAKALKKLGVRFDLILTSPFSRALSTAHIVAAELGLEKFLEEFLPLSSGADLNVVLATVLKRANQAKYILLVGHEPDLSELISVYLSSENGLAIRMKKGGLARISFHAEPAPGQGVLEWLLAPKHLVELGCRE